MKKSNKPSGVSLPPEFREVVKRLKDKEPEIEAVVDVDGEDGEDGEDNSGGTSHGAALEVVISPRRIPRGVSDIAVNL